VLAAFVWLLAAWAAPVAAQDGAAEAEATASLAELESLVATLEDDAEREAFVAQLKALIAADTTTGATRVRRDTLGARLLDSLSEGIERFGDQLAQTAAVLAALPEALARAAERTRDPEARALWLEVALKIVFVIAFAWFARTVVFRLLRRSRETLARREGEGWVEATVLFMVRAFYAFLPITVFAAIALAASPITDPRPATRVIVLGIVNAVIFVQVVTISVGLVLGAGTGRAGIMGVADETAYYVQIWLRRLAVVAVVGYFIAETTLLLGLPAGAHAVLLKLVGLTVAALLVIIVLQNRRPVAEALRPRRGVMARLADIWHVPALVYIAIAYGAWVLQAGTGFAFLARATVATVVVIALAFLALKATRLTFERGIRLSDDRRTSYPGLEERANRYMDVLPRILAGTIYVVATLLLIEVWFGGAFAWLASDLGRAVLGRIVTIALVLAVALALWELVTTLIERILSQADSDGPGSRGARLRTLVPLIRNVVRVVLGVIVTLTVLSELGVSIAPLLAGAGIAGIAIGFGAQSLVKDVLTGVFILLEDSIAVGDVVNVAGHGGIVEGMTMRTVRLRDLSGNVHFVPFGEVASVLNMTKDFSYALIEAGVAYKEDVDQVIEVLKEVGAGMEDDPDFGPMILAPLEVLGLDSFGDSSVNIRFRIRTKPIKQWSVRREYHRRMKRAFDERGIDIPFPHRTIYFGAPTAEAEKIERLVGGAAAAPEQRSA
jgi:small conductance mechanosensitive channel